MSDEPEGTREEGTREGVSRRRVLKGIAAAGAVAWATPVVQTVNMQRAWAQNGSPERVCYRVKVESDGGCDEGFGTKDCLDPAEAGVTAKGGCAAASPVLVSATDCAWVVRVNPNCVIEDATAKVGQGQTEEGCVLNPTVTGLGTSEVTISTCELNLQNAISHVEIVVCCEQEPAA
jgi:hypothetical protein